MNGHAARAEISLLYTCIETFSYTTRVKKAISAQRPNGKDTLHSFLAGFFAVLQ